jgi:hypothetical protein
VFLSTRRCGISSTKRWPGSGAAGGQTIARTANYLEIAQRSLVERRGAAAAHAFAHELSSLRSLLTRVGAQVADERTDLGMEAAELDRLTVELLHKRTTGDPGSVNAFGTH